MMKLILSLTLIWTLSSTAEGLQCSVWDSRGVWGPSISHCKFAELCATAALQEIKNGNLTLATIRLCLPSSLLDVGDYIFSSSFGFDAMSATVHVCNTDGCNNQDIPYSTLMKNNLQCLTCTHPSSVVCHKTVQCVGVQDRCISGTVEDGEGRTTHKFGCVSANFCEVFQRLEFFLEAKFINAPKCCGSSLCNKGGNSDQDEAASDQDKGASDQAEATSDQAKGASDQAEAASDQAKGASDQADTASSALSVNLNVIPLLFGLIILII